MLNFEIDRKYLVEVLQGLVRINSVNPALVEDAPGEAEIAGYTAQLMQDLGLEVHRHEPSPGRVSVVGRLPGQGQGRSLMLNAHYDTVGVEGMPEPFSARIQDGRLYGRGAYDMKASLAASLAALKALQEAGCRPLGDVLIAAVADEEHASLGTADLIPRYPVDAAIVTEPSQLEICLAHKGFMWLQVETQGRAYHGSRPDEGIDANMHMGCFLYRLQALERELRRRPPHRLLGPPSLHAAQVKGGTSPSIYAASCTLTVERRTIPGESAEQVEEEIRSILERLEKEDPDFKASLQVGLVREPFEVSPRAKIVGALETACRDVLGCIPPHAGQNPWMDSALLSAAGVETVVFGPSGAGAHSDNEWVDLDSVHSLSAILAQTTAAYCDE
ncbi:MAG TPA: ArgE/DapE family deacylase [Acidobacteriota bacterium]|nr:ArgE/DapE family deacylase [Acidobacteriota bacterium]